MPNPFIANNWYWSVTGNSTQVWSSAADGFVALSDSTYLAWLAGGNVPTKISANDMLKIRIDLLEAQQTPRRLREGATGSDGGWLANLNAQITTLRSQLT